MGMGEPLDNFDNLMGAIQVMNEQQGFDIALRHMTLSTAGLVPGIERLAKLAMPGLRLAISINAPNDTIRSLLMPLNKTFPLARLKKDLVADFEVSDPTEFGEAKMVSKLVHSTVTWFRRTCAAT